MAEADNKKSGGLVQNWETDVTEAEKSVLDRKLPTGWERRPNAEGVDYFIDHVNKLSHWYRPPILPKGWTMEYDAAKKAYVFCDPVQKTRSYVPPPQPEETKDMWYYSDQAEKYTKAFTSQIDRAVNSESAKQANAWVSKQATSFMGWANNKVADMNKPAVAAPPNQAGPPQAYASGETHPPPPTYHQVEGLPSVQPPQPMPPGPGTLSVKVLSCHGLLNVSQNGGVSTPFVSVWCSLKSGKVNKRTISMPSNLDPHFNTEFVFDITNSAEEGDLRFIVFDEQSKSLKMGETNLSMRSEVLPSDGSYVGYRNLTPSGSILLDVRFTT